MSTSVAPVRTLAQSAVLLTARTAGRLARPFLMPFHGLIAWPVSSHLAARRNALAAEQELLLRRTEREDVERFLAALAVPTPAAALPSAALSSADLSRADRPSEAATEPIERVPEPV